MDSIIIVKPEAYQRFDEQAAANVIIADQRVLSQLEERLVDVGTTQLKAKAGFDREHLPSETPTETTFIADGIAYTLETTVQRVNPKYEDPFNKVVGALELFQLRWERGSRTDGVRTYQVDQQGTKAPFIRLEEIMELGLHYVSAVTELDPITRITQVKAPCELAEETLEKLAVPYALAHDFDIDTPGAARLHYRAQKFIAAVKADTVQPSREEVERRSGFSVEKMPAITHDHVEQLGQYLMAVKSVPSPRRQFGKAFNYVFQIPEPTKEKGSKALPVIASPGNYEVLLQAFEPRLERALTRSTKLKDKMGELAVFHYGVQDHPHVQSEFPQLSAYQCREDGSQKYVSLAGVAERLLSEANVKVPRLLRYHTAAVLI